MNYEQQRNRKALRTTRCFFVGLVVMCLMATMTFPVAAAVTTTSLLDISNWDIYGGTAGMSNGLLTVGAIRSKATFTQPLTFTWKGYFPVTTTGYHVVSLMQPPFGPSGYPGAGNEYYFYTRWENPGNIYWGNNPNGTPGQINGVTAVTGYFYGEYTMVWQNNKIAWYYNGTKLDERDFISNSPVWLGLRAADNQFKIESISVKTETQTTNAACGAANLTTLTAAPITDFCTSGTASAITGSGPWYWTCNGINGGTSIACVANATTLPVDPTTTTSKVYMGTNDRFTASNSGITIYGGAGYDTVTISDGISGVTLDQNVERINFSGAAGNYTFKQTGNRINIYNAAGTLLLASAPVQGDADGTLLGFSNGTASALVSGGVMTVGGALVSTTTAGAITPTLK